MKEVRDRFGNESLQSAITISASGDVAVVNEAFKVSDTEDTEYLVQDMSGDVANETGGCV